MTDEHDDQIVIEPGPSQPPRRLDSINPKSERTMTLVSNASHSIFHSEQDPTPLDALFRKVAADRSLECVKIHSVERYKRREDLAVHYKQREDLATHYFLVLELRPDKKPPIWLRLDRRMHTDVIMLTSLLSAGVAPVNETVRHFDPRNCEQISIYLNIAQVLFSVNKPNLIQHAVLESHQVLERVPTLGTLIHILYGIREEKEIFQPWTVSFIYSQDYRERSLNK